MHFLKKFKKVLRETNSHLVIGLDPDLRKLPKFFKEIKNEHPYSVFNRTIVEATKDIVAGYKLNIAFYEEQGYAGWDAISETLTQIPKDLIRIADAKRGDIENTSELYAKTFFETYDFDAITVHPYMGEDSVRPFLRFKNKFVFLLLLTSNFGSKDFQFLKITNKPLWKHVAEKAMDWNNEKIGFVVGAGHHRELKQITSELPETPLLIPGIGAQKNSLEKLLSSLNHNLWIINQSRSIIYSDYHVKSEKEFKEKVRENAIFSNSEIQKALE